MRQTCCRKAASSWYAVFSCVTASSLHVKSWFCFSSTSTLSCVSVKRLRCFREDTVQRTIRHPLALPETGLRLPVLLCPARCLVVRGVYIFLAVILVVLLGGAPWRSKSEGLAPSGKVALVQEELHRRRATCCYAVAASQSLVSHQRRAGRRPWPLVTAAESWC